MTKCWLVYLYLLLSILVSRGVKSRNVSGDVFMAKAMDFLKDVKFPSHDSFKTKDATSLMLSDNSSKCNNSCKLDITGIMDWSTEYLRSVTFSFRNYKYSISRYFSSNVDFNFKCSSWSSEQVGIFWTSYCKETNADCFKLDLLCVCRCNSGYLMIDGHCLQGNITVKQACVSSLQCIGSQYSQLCVGGVCVCQRGYIPSNNRCLQENLPLTQSCVVNDQCSGSPYASCLGGKCSCIEGYIALNSTDCVMDKHVLYEANLQTKKFESASNNMGHVIGALFCGLLIGVIITSGIAYLIYKRSHYSINKRKEPRVMYAVNDTFDDIRDGGTVQNKASTKRNKDKQKKVVLNVSPLTCPQELPDHSSASGKEPAMSTIDDVYNHLNEKGKNRDEDTYDHACAAAARSHLRDLDDYSNIHAMDDGTVVSGGTENDDYSTLEHN